MPIGNNHRKEYPVAKGVVDYFPDAILAVSHVSKVGNDQHNKGEPLHWSREKSSDHDDCLMRHFIERGKIDTDGLRHTAKMAWRALAVLQLEIETEQTQTPATVTPVKMYKWCRYPTCRYFIMNDEVFYYDSHGKLCTSNHFLIEFEEAIRLGDAVEVKPE